MCKVEHNFTGVWRDWVLAIAWTVAAIVAFA